MTQAAVPKVRYLPPSVRFDARVGGIISGVLAGLWSMGVVAVCCALPEQLDALAVGVAVLLLTAWACYGEAYPRNQVTLDWSAQGWFCTVTCTNTQLTPEPCVPTVVLDFQRLLLVRVQATAGRVRWLWCQRQDARIWHRFRCALFATRLP